ncbi:hypothetical protein DMH04_23040 [Kibdelosporangium aridum]|uniref:Uncharacterized protein n=1 Tax=Kibdelosporangium aridum TaxID=2030 RepID=A0A428Z7F1_KIBAR|nr:hypothetical protein DMH04_23040 [Kibdelosporangium aridum]
MPNARTAATAFTPGIIIPDRSVRVPLLWLSPAVVVLLLMVAAVNVVVLLTMTPGWEIASGVVMSAGSWVDGPSRQDLASSTCPRG